MYNSPHHYRPVVRAPPIAPRPPGVRRPELARRPGYVEDSLRAYRPGAAAEPPERSGSADGAAVGMLTAFVIFYWVAAGLATLWGGDTAGLGIAAFGGILAIVIGTGLWLEDRSGRRSRSDGRPAPFGAAAPGFRT